MLNNSNRGSQRCDYDENNRLLAVSESPVRYSWSQSYGYDQYRSRCISATTTAILPIAVNEPGALSELRAANNMMEGIKDDAAGNRAAYSSFVLNYDGESRNTVGTAESSACVTYVYDGDGCRVKKANSGTVATAIYAYDAMRRMAAEYSVLGTSMSGNIGTIADLTGAVAKDYNYLSFGRMLSRSKNGRANLNFSNDPDIPYARESLTLQQFTGKERDAETGLDFFLARYYSAAQGRFISPDEFNGGPDDALTGKEISMPGPLPYADISNPQSLNKYAYVYNNPLNLTDPDGHCPWCIGAAVGAAMDLGVQIFIDHRSLSKVDWGSVGISAATGAVGGGIAANVGKLATKTFAKMAIEEGANLVVDAVGSAAQQVHERGLSGVSWSQTAMDAGVGLLAGKTVGKYAENAAKASSTVSSALKDSDRSLRIASQRWMRVILHVRLRH
jgi:RHS repeat-associated protein